MLDDLFVLCNSVDCSGFTNNLLLVYLYCSVCCYCLFTVLIDAFCCNGFECAFCCLD